jgi:hypothetical protein
VQFETKARENDFIMDKLSFSNPFSESVTVREALMFKKHVDLGRIQIISF